MVDRGLQVRGREGDHWWLKVFGVEGGGEIVGKKGGWLRGAGCGWFRCCCVSWSHWQDLWLKLQQLSHETEVGWDDCPALLDDVKGCIQPQLLCPHNVGHADGRWAWNACFAVDKDFPPWLLHVICKEEGTTSTLLTQPDTCTLFFFISLVSKWL